MNIEQLTKKLLSILSRIPSLNDEANRTQLLNGLPENPVKSINRYTAPRQDLESIVRSVAQWGELDSGQSPLAVVIENARGLVTGLKIDGELRQLAEDLSHLKEEEKKASETPRVPFTNREQEIKTIMDPFGAAYYVVDAPAGYGKTELLEELERRFKREKWHCAYVKAQSTITLETLTKELAKKLNIRLPDFTDLSLGEQLGAELQKQWQNNTTQEVVQEGIVLLIDLNEKPNLSLLDDLLQTFIPDLEESLHLLQFFKSHHNRFRVVIAGRYLARHIETQRLPVEVISLDPFSYAVICKSIDHFLPDHNTDKMQQLGAHLLYLTGGHPGCMATCLQEIKGNPMSPDKFLQKRATYIWNTIVKPVANLIYNDIELPHLPDSILDWLSVLRYLDLEILKRIIEMDDRLSGLDEYDLEKGLLSTYLVTRNKDGRLGDDITRRVLAIRLRQNDAEDFVSRVSKAEEMCIDRVRQALTSSPDIQFSILWIIESLFQALQKHANEIGEGKSRAKIRSAFMEEDVPRILKIFQEHNLPQKAIERNIDLLIEKMKNDWEFVFTVNYYLRSEQYNNDPYKELVAMIRKFFGLSNASGVTHD